MFKRKEVEEDNSALARNTPFGDDFWRWCSDVFSRALNASKAAEDSKGKDKLISHSSVSKLAKYFAQLNLQVPPKLQLNAVLHSCFARGDLMKAFLLCRFFQLSGEGLFLTNAGYDKLGNRIKLLGSVNWKNVTCYLDSLLFSMFCNLDNFEPLLFVSNSANPLINQLSALLRLYVNLIRSGNLVTEDIIELICGVLYKLGFSEALSNRQQDSALLFGFITDVLSMPMLTFKVDIKHSGKFDEGDHKYSRERILFVSIPEKTQKEGTDLEDDSDDSDRESQYSSENDSVLLEECLEHYFNNSISVRRELERKATEDFQATDGNKVENAPDKESEGSGSANGQGPVFKTSSALSLWSLNRKSEDKKTREVVLPAWMFLRLLPFYTDDNDDLSKGGSESVARSQNEFLNRKPILPICLKRYFFNTDKSEASRSEKSIIIPPIINLPQFVADDKDDELSGNYKLILESAVGHRGKSISLGHFVSLVRKDTTHTLTEEEAYDATWYLFDDLKKENKVVETTFRELFNKEWPYILFYRLVGNPDRRDSNAILQEKGLDRSVSSIAKPVGSNQIYWRDTNRISDSTEDIFEGQNSDFYFENKKKNSEPILDTSPLDPDFIDVRSKYFWYLIDNQMNYYKELVVSDASETDMVLSSYYRRNCQWSDAGKLENIHKFMREEATNLIDSEATDVNTDAFESDESDSERASVSENRDYERTTAIPSQTNDAKWADHHKSSSVYKTFGLKLTDSFKDPQTNDSKHSLLKKRHSRKIDKYRKEKCHLM